jgi:hypothetical protein
MKGEVQSFPNHPTVAMNGESLTFNQQPLSSGLQTPVILMPSGANNINDHLIWSALNVLCCRVACGLIGVGLSMEIRNRKLYGDLEGVRLLSKRTMIWNCISTLFGIVLIIVATLLFRGSM